MNIPGHRRDGRRGSISLQLSLAAMCATLAAAAPDAALSRPITVADGIATRRPFGAAPAADWSRIGLGRAPFENVFVSPDGRRYALLLLRGDLQRNGNVLEVVVGSTDSLEAASRHRTVARLFMSSLGEQFGIGTTLMTFAPAGFNHFAWLDDRRLALLWGDEDNVAQVFAVDTVSGRVEQLTHSPTHVRAYAVRPDGALLFAALAPHDRKRSQELRASGFVVRNAEALSLLAGDADGYGMMDWMYNCELYFQPRRGRARPIGQDAWPLLYTPFALSFSPDGAHAIGVFQPPSIPEAWDVFTDRILRRNIVEFRREGRGSILARTIGQIFVIDLATGAMRPLWDAPFVFSLDFAWSPDGRELALTSTTLPGGAAESLDGSASAVVDVASGRFSALPLDGARASAPRWTGPDRIAFTVGAEARTATRAGGSWTVAPAPAPPPAAAPPVRLELRQDLNTPPKLFGIGADGAERLLLDPNPELGAGLDLARAELLEWTDATGRKWTGLLHQPLNAEPGRRYPLVIQTHGHPPPTQFSLYGKSGVGLGTAGWVHAAQALAGRGMAVLSIQDRSVADTGGRQEIPMYMAGYESAVAELDRRGLIDVNRIGIAGYSRTGWHVEQALYRSRIKFAAALVVERHNPGYFWSVLTGWNEDSMGGNGSPPLGEGLEPWFHETAAAHADEITAPVQLVLHTSGLPSVLNHWETLSRLRYFDKPVEFYVAPDIDHASHGLQNPRQVFALQNNYVDWFDFWLIGPEHSLVKDERDPERTERFNRWAELRAQQCRQPAERHGHAWYCAAAPAGPERDR